MWFGGGFVAAICPALAAGNSKSSPSIQTTSPVVDSVDGTAGGVSVSFIPRLSELFFDLLNRSGDANRWRRLNDCRLGTGWSVAAPLLFGLVGFFQTRVCFLVFAWDTPLLPGIRLGEACRQSDSGFDAIASTTSPSPN